VKPLGIKAMANKDDDGDAAIVTKTRSKTERPPLYKILLLNDDFTPMEFVVYVLERFFGISHDQAIDIMMTVHKKGLAVGLWVSFPLKSPRPRSPK